MSKIKQLKTHVLKREVALISIWAVVLILADQLTKWLAATRLQTPLQLAPYISLEYAENTGVAFSLPVPAVVLIPLSLLLLGVIIVYGLKHLNLGSPLGIAIMSLIIGGAAGNLIDRISRGYVIDFIKVGWWPSFNLADSFLTIGIFLLLLFYGKIKRVRTEEQSERSADRSESAQK